MPIEIRRFGVGHRRADGPPGTVAVRDQVIHSDAALTITELAFARSGRIEPFASPHPIWFIVIEGGGWVGVGEERARVAAGEAVRWPPDVPHAAWTEHSEMRAFTIESVGGDEVIGARAVELLADPSGERERPRPRPLEPDAGEPA